MLSIKMFFVLFFNFKWIFHPKLKFHYFDEAPVTFYNPHNRLEFHEGKKFQLLKYMLASLCYLSQVSCKLAQQDVNVTVFETKWTPVSSRLLDDTTRAEQTYSVVFVCLSTP